MRLILFNPIIYGPLFHILLERPLLAISGWSKYKYRAFSKIERYKERLAQKYIVNKKVYIILRPPQLSKWLILDQCCFTCFLLLVFVPTVSA